MKKILVFILLLAITFLVLGCDVEEEERELPPIEEEDEAEIEEENQEEQAEIFPQGVVNWRRNMRKHFVAGVIDVEDGRYLIVNWGQKPTEGYQVEIKNIKERDDLLEVDVIFAVTDDIEEITYPVAVKRIEDETKDIEFIAHGNEEYIPRIVGEEPTDLFIDYSTNIKITEFSKEHSLKLKGLARVFEANINYTFEREDGEVLAEDFTTAATAGPNWGEFSIEYDKPPEDADYLVVFSVSAKDGSRQDEVRLQF